MKKIISLLFFCMVVLSVSAIPARKKPFTHTQSNGQQISLMLVGDENLHYYLNTETQEKMLPGEDGDFYVVPEAQMKAMQQNGLERSKLANERRLERLNANKKATASSANGPLKVGSFGNMIGSKKGLVILVNFSDTKMATGHTQSTFNDMFNKVGYNENNHLGSVHDYFYDQSYGQFDLTFDVVGPVTVKNTMSYYGSNNTSGDDRYAATMVIEALKLADSQVNFADYDWDGDGEVDQVYVIYAGYGENFGAASNTIWPHEFNLSAASQYYNDGTGAQTLDGVRVDTYACSCELAGTSGTIINGIGTACHEFSHCLGYPDMYDTNYVAFGMNSWDLMDAGSYNGPWGIGEVPCGYTSYERWMAGWMEPTELYGPKTVTDLPSLEKEPKAYVIYNDKNENEYILLENRQNDGKWFRYVDTYTTPHGLLAIHVDYDASAWAYNRVNTTSTHQRMSIIPASGSYGTYNRTYGQYMCTESDFKGQLFGGSGSVSSLIPDSHSSVGGKWFTVCSTGSTALNHEVTDIVNENDGTISFLFDGGADDGNRYTITYDAGTGSCDVSSWTQTESMEVAVLPTAVAPNEEWTFVGWATESVAETNDMPTLYPAGSTFRLKDDITLYAVYQMGEEVIEPFYHYTEDLYLDVDYLIVSKNTAGQAVVLDSKDMSTSVSTSVSGTPVTIYEYEGEMFILDALPTSADWKIVGTTSEYDFQSENGRLYINNGLSLNVNEGAAAWATGYGMYCGWQTKKGVTYYQLQPDANNNFIAKSYTTTNLSTTNRVYLFEKYELLLSEATYCTNPEICTDVTITSVGYGTYYNSKHAYTMPEGLEGYVAYYNNGWHFDNVYSPGDEVPADEALILQGEEGTYKLYFVLTDNENVASNMLEGTDEKTALDADADYYFYALQQNKAHTAVGMYWMNSTGEAFTNGAHKAYMKVAKNLFSSGAKSSGFAFDEATAISNVPTVEDANHNIYNMNGQRIVIPQKGQVYIKDGRKLIAK